ncbi:MAG: hypothetical protein NZT61_01780 [Deltaproteobacteria bacterium]|nr:hypothetical protein [Deltaproteobacteria bacterium]MCX7952321.1 hypothetical protein [Deltaproteobacteria bacterium]
MKKAIFETDFKLDEIKPEIGKTYPIFGVLNDLEISGSRIQARINSNIVADLIVTDDAQIKVLVSRIFDTGIFFVEIKEISEDGIVKGFCSTIIFGKKQVLEC